MEAPSGRFSCPVPSSWPESRLILPAVGRLLLAAEIELDPRAARVEEEQLPEAAAGQMAEIVAHATRVELRDGVAQAGGAEGHVVEHALRVVGQRTAGAH